MASKHFNDPPYRDTDKREAWIVIAACVAFIAVVTAAMVFVRIWMTP